MVIRCGEDMREELLEYLRGEPVYNTFLLADISNFGFDMEFQNVYAQVEEDRIHGVYLTFYQNLIVYSQENRMDADFLKELFGKWTPAVVMGRSADVKQVAEVLPGYRLEERPLYLLKDSSRLEPDNVCDIQAVPGDEEKLFEFLMEIPQMRTLYGSKEMIGDRLKNGDGVHYYREVDGRVVAQANSAARSESTVMIGGVATAPEQRGNRIASALVSRICRDILKEGKTPCLFSEREEDHNLYTRLGFQKIGMWATLLKQEKKLPSYIPVYNQLYQDLMDGVYEKDSLLPSENTLAATYKVSRNTLRQALAILCQDGYIYKRQGKGTYVSYDSKKKERRNLYNFLMDCAIEPIHHVTAEYNVGPPTLIAREKLKLGPDEEVLASNNVYWGKEAPVGQAFMQIPIQLLDKLGVARDDEDALIRFMNEQIYQQAGTGDMTIQVAAADEQVVPFMEIEDGTILLYIEQILYGKPASPSMAGGYEEPPEEYGREGRPLARIKYYFLPEKYKVDCRLKD